MSTSSSPQTMATMEYPKNFSRRIKAFGFPEKRKSYASGHAWQTMDRPGQQIKSGKKTLGIKAFFSLGRHSRALNKPTECKVPGSNQAR